MTHLVQVVFASGPKTALAKRTFHLSSKNVNVDSKTETKFEVLQRFGPFAVDSLASVHHPRDEVQRLDKLLSHFVPSPFGSLTEGCGSPFCHTSRQRTSFLDVPLEVSKWLINGLLPQYTPFLCRL